MKRAILEQSNKTLLLCVFLAAFVLLPITHCFSQSPQEKDEIIFSNGTSNTRIAIGDRIELKLKRPNKKFTATVLSLADSAIVTSYNQPPHQIKVLVSNISNAKVIKNIYRLQKVKVILINNEMIRGAAKFDRSDVKIVSLKSESKEPLTISVTSIREISIKKKHTIALGMLTGILVGGVIGGVTYHKPKPDPNSFITLDFGPGYHIAGGAILGGLSGLIVGAIAGSAPKKVLINGDMESYTKFRQRLQR